MKEGFDGKPIGIRITKRDQDILKYLAKTMYMGLDLSISDVARVALRKGFEAMGVQVTSDYEEPDALPKGVRIDPDKMKAVTAALGKQIHKKR